jgi:outer membrane protein assembly factor BamD
LPHIDIVPPRCGSARPPSRAVAAGLATGLLLILAACADKKDQPYVERPVDQLYNEASAAMDAGDYKKAADTFDEVERQHPYSEWATRAQLMSAYAHYQELKYDDAIVSLDRFIQLHPGSPDIAYAYYLRALSYYEQITDVQRDQKVTQQALDALNEVVHRFPDTEYARDAKIKIDLTTDHLAGKEMEIGRYYLRRGEYTAAIGRFRRVVDNYQTTSHVPEALLRLTEAYMALGLVSEAKQTAAVLGYNFPGSDWYADAYTLVTNGGSNTGEGQKSLVGRIWSSVF